MAPGNVQYIPSCCLPTAVRNAAMISIVVLALLNIKRRVDKRVMQSATTKSKNSGRGSSSPSIKPRTTRTEELRLAAKAKSKATTPATGIC